VAGTPGAPTTDKAETSKIIIIRIAYFKNVGICELPFFHLLKRKDRRNVNSHPPL
jgi:hypothetical protein